MSQRQQWQEAARHPGPGILSSALLCDSAIIGNIIKFSSGLLTCTKAERMRVETESDFLSYVQTIQICILKKNVCGIARLCYFKKTHNRKCFGTVKNEVCSHFYIPFLSEKKLDVGQIESAVPFFLVFLLLLARDTVLILHSLLTLPSQPTLNQLEFKINKLSDQENKF